MKQIFKIGLLVLAPVLISIVFFTSLLDNLSYVYLGIILSIIGCTYLLASLYYKNKQRKWAMSLMLIGELCFVSGVVLSVWF